MAVLATDLDRDLTFYSQSGSSTWLGLQVTIVLTAFGIEGFMKIHSGGDSARWIFSLTWDNRPTITSTLSLGVIRCYLFSFWAFPTYAHMPGRPTSEGPSITFIMGGIKLLVTRTCCKSVNWAFSHRMVADGLSSPPLGSNWHDCCLE